MVGGLGDGWGWVRRWLGDAQGWVEVGVCMGGYNFTAQAI